MSQTAVNEQSDARIGLVADSSFTVKDSFAAEIAIPFGRLVIRGTKATVECTLPGTAGDITDGKKVLGIAIASQNVETPAGTAAPQYPIERTLAVLNFGRVWVETESDSTDTSKDVYVRHTAAGANTKIGVFSDAAGTGLAKLENARWLSEDVLDGTDRIAILEVRL